MRKLFLLAAALVTVLLLTISCVGVSRDAYDNTTAELAIRAAELETLNIKYEQVSGDYATANASIARAKNELAIFNSIFIPAMTGELDTATPDEKDAIVQDIENSIAAMADDTLTRKYMAMKYSGNSDDMVAFFLYLLEDMEKTLE